MTNSVHRGKDLKKGDKVEKHTEPFKSLDIPKHARLFPRFYNFLFCRKIRKASKV